MENAAHFLEINEHFVSFNALLAVFEFQEVFAKSKAFEECCEKTLSLFGIGEHRCIVQFSCSVIRNLPSTVELAEVVLDDLYDVG